MGFPYSDEKNKAFSFYAGVYNLRNSLRIFLFIQPSIENG